MKPLHYSIQKKQLATIQNKLSPTFHHMYIIFIAFELFANNLIGQIRFEEKNFLFNGKATSAGISWVYYNDDIYPDLFFSNAQKQNNTLYLNKGGNGFEKIEVASLTNDLSSTSAAAWADFDNDGDQDVIFGNQHGEDNYLLKNDNGSFVKQQTFEKGDTYHINWIDYNNDGLLDIFIPNAQTGTSQLYKNNSNTFKPLSNFISELKGFHSGSFWVDLDNDNYPDLYLTAAGSQDEFIKYNSESGILVSDKSILGSYAEENNFSAGISFGDLDGDLDLDAFIANLNNQKNVLLINEDGGFVNSIEMEDTLSSWVGLWGDYDNDGDLDLFVTNYDQPNTLFENTNGELKKTNYINDIENIGLYSSGAAWADYNKDGFLDLVIANWENKSNTFLEGVPNENNWIGFRLEGIESNKDAIGTKVQITYEIDDKSHAQIRVLQSNMGLRSYPEKIIHFGLGKHKGSVNLSIKWPSGKEQSIKVKKSNRYYKISEGTDKIIKI